MLNQRKSLENQRCGFVEVKNYVPHIIALVILIDRSFLYNLTGDTTLRLLSLAIIGFVFLFFVSYFISKNFARKVLYLIIILEFGVGIGQSIVGALIFDIATIIAGIFSAIIALIGMMFVDVVREVMEEEAFLRTPKTEYAVVVDNVHKIYRVGTVEVHALRGISLKVKRGEFVAIMGPSGSGKSTLLNMIGALDKPTSGRVYIDGVDITKLDDNQLAILRNKKIGFVFQAYNLINRTTVLRNVEMPAIVAGMPKKERVKKAIKLLKIMGLDESVLKRRPIYLSGGQQQRVAIARALMNDPAIILADEPTGNLDSKTGKEVMRYFRMLNEKYGVTIILVTHDRSVAEMTDRILHIRDGQIIKEEIVGEKK